MSQMSHDHLIYQAYEKHILDEIANFVFAKINEHFSQYKQQDGTFIKPITITMRDYNIARNQFFNACRTMQLILDDKPMYDEFEYASSELKKHGIIIARLIPHTYVGLHSHITTVCSYILVKKINDYETDSTNFATSKLFLTLALYNSFWKFMEIPVEIPEKYVERANEFLKKIQ